MKPAAVPTVLDLWSLGHSASEVARMLQLPGGHKHVTAIIAQARLIKDKRAVLHRTKTGRIAGRLDRAMDLLDRWPEIEIVDSIPAMACPAGHPQTKKNVYGKDYRCRLCRQIRDRKP